MAAEDFTEATEKLAEIISSRTRTPKEEVLMGPLPAAFLGLFQDLFAKGKLAGIQEASGERPQSLAEAILEALRPIHGFFFDK